MGTTLASETTRSSFDELVAAYYEAFDAGRTVDRQAWLEQHPEFADELSRFFADHDGLVGLVAPLKEAIAAPPFERVGAEPIGQTVDGPDGLSEPRVQLDLPTIGEYELIRRLGSGAMGDVYEAR
jgi:hypothetical protein